MNAHTNLRQPWNWQTAAMAFFIALGVGSVVTADWKDEQVRSSDPQPLSSNQNDVYYYYHPFQLGLLQGSAGDIDGDGVANSQDKRPTVATYHRRFIGDLGVVAAQTGSDWDNDGVTNVEDKRMITATHHRHEGAVDQYAYRNEFGMRDYSGFRRTGTDVPDHVSSDGDIDNDGVPDSEDKRPTVATFFNSRNALAYTQYESMTTYDPSHRSLQQLPDDDEDGVPNKYDLQLETPKGSRVDRDGVAVDERKR